MLWFSGSEAKGNTNSVLQLYRLYTVYHFCVVFVMKSCSCASVESARSNASSRLKTCVIHQVRSCGLPMPHAARRTLF